MVEIYGIPVDLYKCPACIEATKLLDEKSITYIMKPVMLKANNTIGFEYNTPIIDEMRKRTKQPVGSFNLPKVFVDGEFIGGYAELKKLLDD